MTITYACLAIAGTTVLLLALGNIGHQLKRIADMMARQHDDEEDEQENE